MSRDLPGTMPAVVLAGAGKVDIEEIDVPAPDSQQVLVEVAACGICGTDLHLTLDGWGPAGTTPGHEFAGRIVALGSAVTGFSVGDVVAANTQVGCGACAACRAGRPSICVQIDMMSASWMGGFAPFAVAPARGLHRLPHGVSATDAALAEPLAVALHAVTRSGIRAGGRAFVTGAGPLGLLCIIALKARGAAEVVVSEPHPTRRAQALAVGADRVMEPSDVPDPMIPTLLVDAPFDVALECAGVPDATAAAMRCLVPGGRMVIVGAGIVPVPTDMTRVMVHEIEVAGTVNYDDRGFDEALGLLADGTVNLDSVCEPEMVPLTGYLDACRVLAAGEIARKVRIDPHLPF